MLNISSASRVLCYFLFALPGGGGGRGGYLHTKAIKVLRAGSSKVLCLQDNSSVLEYTVPSGIMFLKMV